jgi:hypothetical protein
MAILCWVLLTSQQVARKAVKKSQLSKSAITSTEPDSVLRQCLSCDHEFGMFLQPLARPLVEHSRKKSAEIKKQEKAE